MANESLERFRTLVTQTMPKEIENAALSEMTSQAEIMVERIRAAAPVYSGHASDVVAGNLRKSVRIGSSGKKNVVRVLAGGELTTMQGEKRPYDYARAVEFGTVHMAAHPFFFSTYRAMKQSLIINVRHRIEDVISDHSESGRG